MVSNNLNFFYLLSISNVRFQNFGGRDSVVAVGTRYLLNGLALEPWWGAEFFRTIQDRP